MRIHQRTPAAAGADAAEDPLVVLDRLVTTGAELLPTDVLEPARALLERAGQRRRIAPGVSVVALLGATGSGKSSLFNTLCGIDAAPTAVTRPTTTEPLAALPASPAPATDGAMGRLLDWLGVDTRVRLPDAPSWGPAAVGVGDNTILLDLPDIDSDVRRHRAMAERLAGLVDVLVWVLDPEKYADAVIHHEFITPMAAHAAVSVVALNQMDRLDEAERAEATRDLTRLLAREGLDGVDVIQVSARTGQGVQELRARIREVAAAKDVSHTRLVADARALAARARDRLEPASPAPGPVGLTERESLKAFQEAACQAVGTDRVATAVAVSMRLGAARRVGWLPARWLSRLRTDRCAPCTSVPTSAPAGVQRPPRRSRSHVPPCPHPTRPPPRPCAQPPTPTWQGEPVASAGGSRAGVRAPEPEGGAALRPAGRRRRAYGPGADQPPTLVGGRQCAATAAGAHCARRRRVAAGPAHYQPLPAADGRPAALGACALADRAAARRPSDRPGGGVDRHGLGAGGCRTPQQARQRASAPGGGGRRKRGAGRAVGGGDGAFRGGPHAGGRPVLAAGALRLRLSAQRRRWPQTVRDRATRLRGRGPRRRPRTG
ncbi:hypothetical protein BW737_011995 [Actinomyces ruminis]|uniref:G domain-containing protein n=1 Tax=Actinomyces ruminis TaxID=1937003 RepID=A0ABX4M9G2_9ACTO|nr:hypothetical protein BW737_011995 [Actinomyces ruminis]